MRHGGQLAAAASRYGIPEVDWLDVSTGIAPWSWPVPSLPETVWARLPEMDDGLLQAAAGYYGCAPDLLTAVPGSQYAIRQLPRLLAPATVAVPAVGYAEHAHGWRAAGHRLLWYRDVAELPGLMALADHAVVLNPDNPTGRCCSAEWLLALRREMQETGLLVVDEAFMDTGRESLIPHLPASSVVVLRSVGKFFGLAGLRLGFVIGNAPQLALLGKQILPWGVSHPARWVGAAALVDRVWQVDQRRRIANGAERLMLLLQRAFDAGQVGAADLFATVFFADDHSAPAVHNALARQGVLTRLGDNHRWLRFGLPADGEPRLIQALQDVETA